MVFHYFLHRSQRFRPWCASAMASTASRACRACTRGLRRPGGAFHTLSLWESHENPWRWAFEELIAALRHLGYRVDTGNDKLPALFYGAGPKKASVTVSVEDSSQFASALLLSSRAGGWEVSIPTNANPDELPYVAPRPRNEAAGVLGDDAGAREGLPARRRTAYIGGMATKRLESKAARA